jgi:hypothetical protein
MVVGRSLLPGALLIIAPSGTQIRVQVRAERVEDEVPVATDHLHELQIVHHGEVATGHEGSDYRWGMAQSRWKGVVAAAVGHRLYAGRTEDWQIII